MQPTQQEILELIEQEIEAGFFRQDYVAAKHFAEQGDVEVALATLRGIYELRKDGLLQRWDNLMRNGEMVRFFGNAEGEPFVVCQRTTLVDGVPNGECQWMYPSGGLSSIEVYEMGERVHSTAVDGEGQVISKTSYKNNTRHGLCTSYHGAYRVEKMFDNGNLVSQQTIAES